MSPPQQQLDKAKPGVPRETVVRAVASLTGWMRKRAAEAPPNLLADERDDVIILQLSLRRIPTKSSPKPHLLPLPHPVVAHSSASVCVISDDRAGSTGSPAPAAILDAAKSLGLPVSDVIPFSAIRTDYRAYESRRRFAASHDLFLADRALLPMLPRLLGKAFYSTKKAPLAVDFTRAGWPEQVRKLLGSTYLYLRTGTCAGIKVGRLDMEEEEIVDNVVAAVEAAVEKVPKKWANVRALHLKAVDSVALPIYQVVPELGLKIEVPKLLEGGIGAGEVIDAAEAGKKGRDKKMKALKNAEGAKELKYKRKRNKKDQAEDVVMEEAQEVSEKRRKKEDVPSVEVSAVDEGLKVAKKLKDKKKRALDVVVEDASPAEKKGKKGEVKEEKKKKKKSMKGSPDDGEILVDGENIPDTIRAPLGGKDKKDKEGKKSKEKKSSGDKMKIRTSLTRRRPC